MKFSVVIIKKFNIFFILFFIFAFATILIDNGFLEKVYSQSIIESTKSNIPDDLNFSGLDFTEADLSYSNLENSKMYGTIFEGADLSYSNLRNAELAGASRRNDYWEGAFL